MKTLSWNFDLDTQRAALEFQLPLEATAPRTQFTGYNFNPDNWQTKVLETASWPRGNLLSSPESILQQFAEEKYLEALALVVSWGKMWRKPAAIYGNRDLTTIQATLAKCTDVILRTSSVTEAWSLLSSDDEDALGWSEVITSKTLHFLCRALGYTHNGPVAIDNRVIRNKIWPIFHGGLSRSPKPKPWNGKDFSAYNRYMTAILVWADLRKWTTTEMEVTLFAEYY